MPDSPTRDQLTSQILSLLEEGVIEPTESIQLMQMLPTLTDSEALKSGQRILAMLQREQVDPDDAVQLLESLAARRNEPECALVQIRATLSQAGESDEPTEELVVSLCEKDQLASLLPRGIRAFLEQQGVDLQAFVEHLNPDRIGTMYLARSGDWELEIALED